jgi:hypothetical protein
MGMAIRFVGISLATLAIAGSAPLGADASPKAAPKLSRSPHIDLRGAYMFNPPDGWEGTPADGKYFGMGSAELSKTQGTEFAAWYNWSAVGEGNLVFVCRDSDYTGNTDSAAGDAMAWLENTLSRSEVSRQVKLDITAEDRGALGNMPAKVLSFTEEVKQITVEDAKRRKELEERQLKRTLRGRMVVCANDGKLWGCGMVTTAFVHRENAGLDALCDKMWKTFRTMSKGDMTGYNKKFGKGEVICADWRTHQTKNYKIMYNTDDKFAQKLGMHLEAIRQIYARLWPMSGQTKPFLVKAFNSQLGYHKAGGPWGSAGYFSPSQKELVTYKTDPDTTLINDAGEPMTFELGEAGDTSFHIMYHEAFHQYARIHTGENRYGVEIPSWFNEGMGDYFFGGHLKGRSILIEANWWRVDTIKRHVRRNTHVPFKKILKFTQMDYYADASKCYAQGWAMCYYLLEAGPKRIPQLAGKFQSVPVTMMHELEKHGNGQKATDKSWEGIDLDAVEKDWKEWVLQLEFPPHVQAALAKAEAKANQALIDEAALEAKEWTKRQKLVKDEPPCTGLILQIIKGGKFKGCCRGAYESEFKERTMEECKEMITAAITATSNNGRLITGTIYFPLYGDDEAEVEALIEKCKELDAWCEKNRVSLNRLPAGIRRARKSTEEGGD